MESDDFLETRPYFWAPEDYFVREDGHIISKTGRVLKSSPNAQGIRYLSLRIDGATCVRSVARIVAETFLTKPIYDHFDTPMHLDGDKSNCAATNLVWRSRSFAIMYHQHIRYASMRQRIRVVETGEVFDDPRDLCMAYGIQPNTMRRALAYPETRLFPINCRIERI